MQDDLFSTDAISLRQENELLRHELEQQKYTIDGLHVSYQEALDRIEQLQARLGLWSPSLRSRKTTRTYQAGA
ncbi:hypothetical protein IQ22_00280 [Pseudomonas duriflava]|uniref:Uncharacterized protein n=1 Tax=Pseudomonas duriflava TaxID=459528 RepID=A0A562QPA8_9PSED|nr:hypothetical protein [Pseudomonas duriflava]TWI58574.1 hypothetical protein IQ22_00280 [Pseudomonas duriflava]